MTPAIGLLVITAIAIVLQVVVGRSVENSPSITSLPEVFYIMVLVVVLYRRSRDESGISLPETKLQKILRIFGLGAGWIGLILSTAFLLFLVWVGLSS